MNTFYDRATRAVAVAMIPLAAVVGFASYAAFRPITAVQARSLPREAPPSPPSESPPVAAVISIPVQEIIGLRPRPQPKPIPAREKELRCKVAWTESAVGGRYSSCEWFDKD